MTENRASSGVRNLRAMFESQSAASSPEPRGRSPAGTVDADGARPTSKVRASFVFVEPSGHVTRDPGVTKAAAAAEGTDTPQVARTESPSVGGELGESAVAELNKAAGHKKEARKDSADSAEAIPDAESAMPNLGSIMKGSDFPEPQTAEEEKPKAVEPVQALAEQAGAEKVEKKLAALALKDAPVDPKDEPAVSGGEALPPPAEALPSASAAKAASEKPKTEASTPSKAKANGTSAAAAAKKPAAISTAKASAARVGSLKSPLPKSPGVARLPKTPTTPKATSSAPVSKTPAPAKEPPKPAASKEPAKASAPKASRPSLRPSTASATANPAAKAKAPVTESRKPAAKPTTPAPAPAPAPKDSTTTSPGGFKKPRPKSPTRPVRLPSHLTAPTASSAAKHGDDATQKPTRKPSTVSRSTPPKVAAAARKQPSRASLAPSTASTKRPDSRASTVGAPDEGFLARMMRPTASSASKSHEKPASPPRRGPSVRASAKPKTAQESTVAKGKMRVGEIAPKAKEAVTNGHSEAAPSEAAVPAASNGTVPEASGLAQPPVPEREATPVEHVESSAVELQTPNSEGQAIR